MTAASIINFTGKVVHYEEAKHVDTVNLLPGGGGGGGGEATADVL